MLRWRREERREKKQAVSTGTKKPCERDKWTMY